MGTTNDTAAQLLLAQHDLAAHGVAPCADRDEVDVGCDAEAPGDSRIALVCQLPFFKGQGD